MDSVFDIIGDYQAFFLRQKQRLLQRGIAIDGFTFSHLAFRVPEYEQYLHMRTLLERHALANLENVWNGRPISKILLREPLQLDDKSTVEMIELIPPVHQRIYRMGLEHIGIIVGESVEQFSRDFRAVLTGQQFQSPTTEPYYILFEDFTHVKFYRIALREACEQEGGRFSGFTHVENWKPQSLSTSTRGG